MLRESLSLFEQRAQALIATRQNSTTTDDYYRLIARQKAMFAARRAASAGDESGANTPLDELRQRFELNPREEELLLLLAALFVSERLMRQLLIAQGLGQKNRFVVGFISEFVAPSSDGSSWTDWLEPGSKLRSNGLVEIRGSDGEALGQLWASVRVPGFIALFLQGADKPLDRRLTGCCVAETPELPLYRLVLMPATRAQIKLFSRVALVRQQNPGPDGTVAFVDGPRQSGKSAVVHGIACGLGKAVVRLDLSLAGSGTHFERLLQLAVKNARFNDSVLHLDHFDSVPAERRRSVLATVRGQQIACLVERCTTLSDAGSADSRECDFTITVDPLDNSHRQLLWEALIPPRVPVNPDLDLAAMAHSYQLSGGQIHRAVSIALHLVQADNARELSQAHLETGARSQLNTPADQLSNSGPGCLGLDDLILPREVKSQVEALLVACRNRERVMTHWGLGARLTTGRGVVALFHGEPGCGKTFCAEILARELGRPLEIVSLPQILSKWVGETEKNLREIFVRARARRGILLFDEADSLFSKRVKVERAQDSQQNREVNQLLQEVERFDGIVIMTSNLKSNMDPAFMRRILYQIEFPMPERDEREQIWRTLLPPQVPLDDSVDLHELASAFDISGGLIKNAILRACYQCYGQPDGVTQHALLQSAVAEARNAGRLVRESDLYRWERSRPLMKVVS